MSKSNSQTSTMIKSQKLGSNSCKRCAKEKQTDYYIKNKDKVLERKKIYRSKGSKF